MGRAAAASAASTEAAPTEAASAGLAAAKGLRADARRNRGALLAAASEAFTEHGVDASLEDIAKRAGVGIGTLYRHFPTRDALVEAAYRDGVERLCDHAGDLLAANPPDVALETWMRAFVDYVATKRGLGAALKLGAADHSELFAYVHGLIDKAVGSMLTAGADARLLRGDAQPHDIVRALGGLCMNGAGQPGWHEQTNRLVSLLMDGLRYGAGDGR